MFRNVITLAAVMAVTLTAGRPGISDEVSLRVQEGWSGLFGGQPAEFHATVTAGKSFEGRVGWSLTIGRHTVARREATVTAGPGKAGTFEIRVDLPPVRDGVIVPAELSIVVLGSQNNSVETSLKKRLWIFPEDPFTDRREWLKQLHIHLFDPEGNTRTVFEAMDIPFSQTSNVDSLGVLKGGLLVIGEGTSFEDYRGLPEMLVHAAARGVGVLCLAPSGGQFPMPGAEGHRLPNADRITLRRSDVIGELDKRLDAWAWPPDGKVVASSLAPKAEREHLLAEVVAGSAGWPWLLATFPGQRGKLVVCGFGIIEHWNAGPSPRFLLARILEYVNTDNSKLQTFQEVYHEEVK